MVITLKLKVACLLMMFQAFLLILLGLYGYMSKSISGIFNHLIGIIIFGFAIITVTFSYGLLRGSSDLTKNFANFCSVAMLGHLVSVIFGAPIFFALMFASLYAYSFTEFNKVKKEN